MSSSAAASRSSVPRFVQLGRAHVGRSAGAVHFSKADINAGDVPPAIMGRKQTNQALSDCRR
jgi:hypothetical protein